MQLPVQGCLMNWQAGLLCHILLWRLYWSCSVFFYNLPTCLKSILMLKMKQAVNQMQRKLVSGSFPHLLLGVVALFFYVGVEVIAGDSIIRYGQSIGIAMDSAKYFTSLTLLSMILGYLIGIVFIPKYMSQTTALKMCTILGVIFSLGAILTPSHLVFSMSFIDIMTFRSIELVLPVTVLFVALLGLANALVWPAMWPLALNGLGRFTKTGSAMLIMAIAGGALIPLSYGKLAVIFSTQSAYWICVPSYLIIMYYAFIGHKAGK